MKILVYGGGLGNQIFEYAFTQFVRKMHPNQKVFGVYSQARLNEHRGLEIDKWFDVEMPPSKWYATLLTYILYVIKKTTGWTGLLDLNQLVMTKENALVYFAQHTDKRYIPEGEWLRFNISDERLGEKNLSLLKSIRNSNSVFVHVRRGDYQSPKYKDRFEGCCTLDYYQRAIEYVEKQMDHPVYYVFSDDISWSKENLSLKNAAYVDWNTDDKSPLDMYLMSQCKAGVMANSTFSYWGAMLGVQKKIVTYPEKWVNPPFEVGDIFPGNWVKL